MGRLKPGVTIKQAQADMDDVTAHIAQAFPKSNKGWGSFVEPLKNDFMPKERIQTLWLLLGAVGFVLLIACVNVANLLLAKGMTRQKEMAIRGSLGAAPRTIFAQLLTESLLLALAGGALGVGVGYAMLHGLVAAMPPNTLPIEADLSLNLPILLFTFSRPRSPDSSSAARPPGMHRASIPLRHSKKVAAPAPALAAIACAGCWSSANLPSPLPCLPAPVSPFTVSGISCPSISASRPITS